MQRGGAFRCPRGGCGSGGGLRRRQASTAAAGEKQTVDYIILGAGSAGCVVASRLTEDADVSVCLLEAGPRDTGSWDSWKIRMPAALTFNLNDTKYTGTSGRRRRSTSTAAASTSRAARCLAAHPG